MFLRAHYFVQLWQAYLRKTGHSIGTYCLLREALDVIDWLVQGYIGLMSVYRDYYSDLGSDGTPYPLLPWLHSTEACEHTFGCCRRVTPDFTLADFCNMTEKLRGKVLKSVCLAQATQNSKARAAGYNHTYMDYRGIKICCLGWFVAVAGMPPLSPTVVCSSPTVAHHRPLPTHDDIVGVFRPVPQLPAVDILMSEWATSG